MAPWRWGLGGGRRGARRRGGGGTGPGGTVVRAAPRARPLALRPPDAHPRPGLGMGGARRARVGACVT